MQELVIISYNVHSVLSRAGFDALLEEIKDIEWDIIVLVETWREAVASIFYWKQDIIGMRVEGLVEDAVLVFYLMHDTGGISSNQYRRDLASWMYALVGRLIEYSVCTCQTPVTLTRTSRLCTHSLMRA